MANYEPYEPPEWLPEESKKNYLKWMNGRASAQRRRDRKRDVRFGDMSFNAYKAAVHDAVIHSKRFDAYTGEALDWHLIRKYSNHESKKMRGTYKKTFWQLPSVDHVRLEGEKPEFKICSWRMNDFKGDMNEVELEAYCIKFLEARGYQVTSTQPGSAQVN